MPMINFHPSPGLGELLPGWFIVPQNPITAAMGVRPVLGRVPKMGELVRAHWTLPQNPLINSLATVGKPYGMSSLNCAGCDDRVSLGSLGEFNLSDLTNSLSQNKTLLLWGGAALILFLILMSRPGKSAYQQAMSEAKESYRKRVSEIKRRYPRVGGRVARAGKAFSEAF